MKKEFDYQGVTIVFGDELMRFDDRREFLVNCLLLYANRKGRDVKIIFFNTFGDGVERSISIIFYPPKEGALD